jgi:hypothetical protein
MYQIGTPEQSIKLELLRLLIEANIPPFKIVDYAIPLLKWILENDQTLPCNIDDKA